MSENPFLAALEAAVAEARRSSGTLDERLGLIRDRVTALDAGFAGVVERMIDRLKLARAGQRAPRPGEPMPEFALPDDAGRIVTLSSLRARGPVAISFHRGHWCPYCRTNLYALGQIEDEIAALGASIVAIMPERRRYAAAMKADARARFPLLIDIDNGYASSLNLVIWIGAEMQEVMAAGGFDLPRYQGNPAWLLPLPAAFIVRPDGIIAARYVNQDYRTRIEPPALVAELRRAAISDRAIPLRA